MHKCPSMSPRFLLNEKRAELFAMEERLDVNVVLIPNIHLENPHYEINRIRIDDVEEDGEPSYKRVAEPEEDESAKPFGSEKPKPPVLSQLSKAYAIPSLHRLSPLRKSLLVGQLQSLVETHFRRQRNPAAPLPKPPKNAARQTAAAAAPTTAAKTRAAANAKAAK